MNPKIWLFKTVACLLAISSYTQAQTIVWNRLNSKQKIARSVDGNYFWYYVHNDSFSAGPDSVYKITENGQMLWAMGFPDNVYLRGLAATPDSGLCLLGGYSGSFSYAGFTLPGAYPQNMWLGKCDKSGVMEWVISGSGTGAFIPECLTLSEMRIVLAGECWGDSLNFLGHVIHQTGTSQIFVAAVDHEGEFIAFKNATRTTTVTNEFYSSNSAVNECATDTAGNVYLVARSFGLSNYGGIDFGKWQYYNDLGMFTQTILKLGPDLNPLRKTDVDSCWGDCDHGPRILVRRNGEVIFTINSGFYDELNGRILKLGTAGNITGTYSFDKNRRTSFNSLAFDECENIYFTGFRKDTALAPTNCFDFIAGKISPALKQEWLYKYADCNNAVKGDGILYVGDDACIVSGQFYDTLKLNSPLYAQNTATEFLCRINGTKVNACAKPVDLRELSVYRERVNVYPNPANSFVKIGAESEVREIQILSIAGQILVLAKNSHVADVSGLPSGIYLLKIFRRDATIIHTHLLVQH